MRIATTLLLGAAVLAGASAFGIAQGASESASESVSVRPLPAVPPLRSALKSDARQAAIVSSGAPAPNTRAVPGKPGDAPPDASAPPTAAAPDATAPAATSAVQEAKNNSGAVIDATSDTNPNDSNSIVATVNDESISDFELRQRMALYLALQGINQQLTPEQRARIRTQILEVLESEKLELQEAVKKKITVSPVEVDKRINNMLQEYHFTIEQLRQNLTNAGASEEALRSQITASVAWQKAVQDEYGERINITPDMVSTEMARYADGADKPHYRVLEIFL
ncbi:MAG TPA: SurA N-terminal domain-containing protein, partial [Rhizomicrobium sp.]|nr:SurA N-terminal domain-containing protein [Rhizomicrobium sp.]